MLFTYFHSSAQACMITINNICLFSPACHLGTSMPHVCTCSQDDVCRVYLIGGADAASTHDIVPVYTPASLDEGQLLLWNVTLPPGYFSAAPERGRQYNGVFLVTA